jgi:anti-sigma factor RsiW
MTDEELFQRLRGDAAPLRYEPDPFTLARIRARIRERVQRPTVSEQLAAWFRPLAVALSAIGIAAVIGIAAIDTNDNSSTLGDSGVEIVMAGDTYSVGP